MSPEEKPPENLDSGSFSDSPEVDSPHVDENRMAASPQPSQPEATDSSVQPIEAAVVENATDDDLAQVSDPIMAEIAGQTDSVGDVSTLDHEAPINSVPYASVPTPIARNLENMSANGGAIGSLVLGVWCVLGSFITTFSIINGLIGLLMGFWGLTSRKQRTAWIGIVLCIVGIFLSLIQVNELINMYLNAVEET